MAVNPLLGLRGAALAATSFLTAQEPAPHASLPVPSAAAIAGAQSVALRALVERLTALDGGNLWRTQHELDLAAQAAADPAAKYVLLHEGIAVAERAGDTNAALMGIAALARVFAVDEQALSQELLLRLREAPRPARVNAAFTALRLARGAAVAPADTAMLRFHDAALRAALHADDVWVYECVRDRIVTLRAAHDLWRVAGTGPEGRRDCAAAFIGDWLEPAADCSSLATFVQAKANELDGVAASALGETRLRELAATATNPVVRDGLRKLALSLHAGRFLRAAEAPAGTDAAIAELIAQLATDAGVTALHFRERADLDQLVRSNGNWRIHDGLLIGACTGVNNFATHRLSFGSMQAVLIRGGIRSAAGLNFRCKVGDVNLLLNWEVRPENHMWYQGNCTAKGPPALQPGKEHTLLFLAVDSGVLVCIDGLPWWDAPGRLEGTITVYPALGSEIFVREILVVGEPATLVAGPSGELK